jgi:hypothetical protein
MNQRQFASVLFAVVGIFVAITRINELIIHIGLITRADAVSPVGAITQRYVSAIGIVATLAAMLAGVALILTRDWLAERLFPAEVQAVDMRGAQAAVLSVLGCYFAVHGVARLGWAGQVNWTAVTELVLGVALFFGASGLSGLWLRARSASIT